MTKKNAKNIVKQIQPKRKSPIYIFSSKIFNHIDLIWIGLRIC